VPGGRVCRVLRVHAPDIRNLRAGVEVPPDYKGVAGFTLVPAAGGRKIMSRAGLPRQKMEERVRCPRCWKRVPLTAGFCPRCGYCLRRTGPAVHNRCNAVPLLLSGIGLAASLLSFGWLMIPSPATPATPIESFGSPSPPPYAQSNVRRRHRGGAPVIRWPAPPNDEMLIAPPPPAFPPPYRTRYAYPPRPRPLSPYVSNGHADNPYVYPSPDPPDSQH